MIEDSIAKCKQIVLNLYDGLDMDAEGDAFKDICVQTYSVKQAFAYIDYCKEKDPTFAASAIRRLRDECENAADSPNNTDETRRTFIVMAETFHSIMRIFQEGGRMLE